jgi:PadR family transcriptional regulator, regulatory protein AphA
MRQTDYVILGLLSEGPLTGYQIKRLVDLRFRFFWSESFGQLYPALKALAAAGLIAETGGETKRNHAQRAYQIKEEGLAALKLWLARPVARESVRLEILMKLYFAHLAEAGVMAGHLRLFQERHEQDLAFLRMAEKELRAIADHDPNHPYILQVVDCGLKVNEAYLKWSRVAIKFVESRVKK